MEELIEKGLELVAEAAIPALVGIGTAIAGLFVGVVVYKLVVKQLSKSNLISVVFRALEPLFSKGDTTIADMDKIAIKDIIDKKGKKVVKLSVFENNGVEHKAQITCEELVGIKKDNVYAIV